MRETPVGIRVRICIAAIAAATFLAWGCGGGGAVSAPAPIPPAAPAPSGNALGDPPALVAESAEAPDLSSPEKALRSILAGRARQDLPFLARCESVTAGKERLDSLDEARAWRTYCMKSVGAFWSKIEEALEGGNARFTEDGDSARGVFEVGGSLGETELRFVRIGGRWYVEMGE